MTDEPDEPVGMTLLWACVIIVAGMLAWIIWG